MMPYVKNVFDRCGLAALSDLDCDLNKKIFFKLEKEQEIFLSKEREFRSKEYKWPRDPLHNFSRVWEYPYVYHHLAAYLRKLPQNSRPIIADVGSGVTFFPFSLAKLGYKVICTDIDPICEKDLSSAHTCVKYSPGDVYFRLIIDNHLPFDDAECDAVYCISVLEHISDFDQTISEMARILKKGGLCLITCDINLREKNSLQFNAKNYKHLLSSLSKNYERIYPEITIHPTDMLTTMKSPYPFLDKSDSVFIKLGWNILKQRVIKPLMRREPGDIGVPHVAVLGLVLRKRT